MVEDVGVWPGWNDLKPERRREIREQLLARHREKQANTALDEAMAAVVYRHIDETARLFRDHATESEREQERRIDAESDKCAPDLRHLAEEQWQILYMSIVARRDEAEARAREDVNGAARIANAHTVWLRRMHAMRASLDLVGLQRAMLSVGDHHADVTLMTARHQDLTEHWPAFLRALRARLGRDDMVRVSRGTAYEVKLPEK